ncbi:hypothetical protein HYH03_013103 [Edaphochlamys debaryana]|uniref:Uncharacterized protein n=1 Tax=Edaphochlamys debaryana TaxID=47281 RepID=A0A835XZD6_9CHLO|nr:hypothetical protein HYH03_013103 [Edaphochlamys debaryana]|eukprot:KAG2488419.1 hypothetical protein HYH03_013103 [Edaphochlamys debaryana]
MSGQEQREKAWDHPAATTPRLAAVSEGGGGEGISGGGEAWAGAEATAGDGQGGGGGEGAAPPGSCWNSAALVCRGWAVVAAPELGRRRNEGARARWAAASRALPVFSGALAEVDLEEVRSLADEESSPPPVVQLFFALDLLWRRHERRREWPVRRPPDQFCDPAALNAEDRELRGSDLAPAEWDLEDPAWRQGRWEAARQMLRSPPDFQRASLYKALPLGPAAMARLRRRMGMTTAGLGGGWEPGPRLPLLVPGEVAAHSPVAGRLAEWLMGAQELMRAGYEAEAAKDWAWPAAFVRSVVDSAALKLAALGLPALPPLPPHDAALGEALAAVEGVTGGAGGGSGGGGGGGGGRGGRR